MDAVAPGSDAPADDRATPRRRVAVRVTKDALRQIRAGHPWVFESSITSCSDGGQAGDLAVVFDEARRFQGIGLYDPDSPIRVRMLHHGSPVPIDDSWWRGRMAEALARRATLLESTDTTGLRCVHGENDGLPGLVVDLYAGTAVVKIYSAAWLAHLGPVVAALDELLAPDVVVLRTSRALRNEVPDPIDGRVLRGDSPTGPVLFLENGLVLEADVVGGSKTGHFLDQRDNRRLVGAQAAGARVLDVFACTGGFSLAAAAGGARSVRSVDLSARSLATARANFDHNTHLRTVRACRWEATVGDAFTVMAALGRAGERYDVVVVDPPSFAHTRAAVPGALLAYRRLAELAFRLVDDRGLLVQSSCSGRVGIDDLVTEVLAGAAAAGGRLDVIRTTGHPLDHPVGFAQGGYLKTIFARVHRSPTVGRGGTVRR